VQVLLKVGLGFFSSLNIVFNEQELKNKMKIEVKRIIVDEYFIAFIKI